MPPNFGGTILYSKGPAFDLGPQTSIGMLQLRSTYIDIHYYRSIPLFGAYGEGFI
jgi:hypothetical protein